LRGARSFTPSGLREGPLATRHFLITGAPPIQKTAPAACVSDSIQLNMAYEFATQLSLMFQTPLLQQTTTDKALELAVSFSQSLSQWAYIIMGGSVAILLPGAPHADFACGDFDFSDLTGGGRSYFGSMTLSPLIWAKCRLLNVATLLPRSRAVAPTIRAGGPGTWRAEERKAGPSAAPACGGLARDDNAERGRGGKMAR
jgi:hypothetical protein